MGSIVAVVNNKGGVGKTTVTCNLAHALGLAGCRVLVVDLDSQCNATQMLLPPGWEPKHSLYEFFAREELPVSLDDCLVPTVHEGVFCVPNVPETAALEPQLIMQAPASFQRLRRSLREPAKQQFDFTILDNPPNIGTFVLCALHAADFVLVPVKAGSAFSVAGLLKASRLVNEVRQQGNGDLRQLRLLINQVDRRTSISKSIAAQLAAAFRPDQIFATSIPMNTLFERAEMARQTILAYAPRSSGTRAFHELARELLSTLPPWPRGPEREKA
ncbi:MAG: ParA family protein [Desulfobacca sp.]|uniref:ParA family protein n=1 Tax=Desulfobacca sp. TaxID=2067990 RepID=UPI00404ABCEA